MTVHIMPPCYDTQAVSSARKGDSVPNPVQKGHGSSAQPMSSKIIY